MPAALAQNVYQETFSDDTSDLPTTYGFTIAGWNAGGSYTAAGGEAVLSGTGTAGGRLGHTLASPFAYDWSNPLTLTADLRSTQTTGNSTYGIWMGNLAYSRNIGGYLVQGRGGDFTGGNQITGWLENQNALTNGTTFNISITVRENVDNSANFDVLFQVNGVDQGIGWYTGLSKTTYGLGGSISTLGVRADGLVNTVYLDNLTLSVAGGTVATTTELVSSENPSVAGGDVTFTATVKEGANTALAATGTITFSIDEVQVAVEAVTAGQASFSTNSLVAGDHAVTATYSGDAAYGTSAGSLTQSITPSAYDIWADGYELAGGPDDDDDNDGMSNFREFAFGLVPTSGASVNPITDVSNLETLSQFSYTRNANSGLTYTIWTSVDLDDWGLEAAAVTEQPGPVDEETGVQSVAVELLDPPVGDRVFIRVKAE